MRWGVIVCSGYKGLGDPGLGNEEGVVRVTGPLGARARYFLVNLSISFVILATKRRVRTHSVPRHPDWSLAANWRDFARLSSAARAKRGETNGADPPRTTFARPRHQHRRDAAHTTHPNHGPKCEKLPGRVRETSTNRNARAVRGAPRLAAGHSSIATTGARDAHELLTARRPDSSAFRRTRAHDVAAKGRTRPNVRRL